MSQQSHAILNPASIAVIGASSDPLKFGGRVIHYVVKHGFPGRIVPINASAKEVLGLPAFPSIVAVTRMQLAAVRASADAKEGVTAFKEKRRPRFTGR